jgi:hypothetical protein
MDTHEPVDRHEPTELAHFAARIASLTPPRSHRDALLLELYEQLLEKHDRSGQRPPDLPAQAA